MINTNLTQEQQSKQNIKDAIDAFQVGKLADNAIALLNLLGYQSDKRIELDPPTAQTFLATFDSASFNFKSEQAQMTLWSSVDVIFQLTNDELNTTSSNYLHLDFGESGISRSTYNSFLFFAVELKPGDYSRTKLANITREINKLFQMPVSVIFKYGQYLTFSIVTHRPNRKDSSKDVLEKVTLIKDIDITSPHRAHTEILYDLSLPQLHLKFKFSNFDSLQAAWKQTLDSSELNRRFFQEIADWYFWAVGHVSFPTDSGPTAEVRNATGLIRLLTRLIFVWFLKEKNLIPDRLFNRQHLAFVLKDLTPDATTYYKAILQNLFFATLNQEMNTASKLDNRRFRRKGQNYNVTNLYRYEDFFQQPAEALDLFADIPFLNGGLFECLDKPEKDSDGSKPLRIDGFSDRTDIGLSVPNFLFFAANPDGEMQDLTKFYGTNVKRRVRGLVDILGRYKFTITENTPIEEEIALDPELLGKVFENLLAYYNPETQTTARKQTGSFYTPREIVNYMVDESLIACFRQKLEDVHRQSHVPQELEARLRHLFAFNGEPHKFSATEVSALIKAIDQVKVLDPACGSGAFPMGILHRLVTLLQILDPHNTEWKQRQLSSIDDLINNAQSIPDSEVREEMIINLVQKREITLQAFDLNLNELDYGRKLFLIQNCIYGVDIQPIAVQIAKLRCFISLIVDQKVVENSPNRGLRPLPNLETKFVAANSLLKIEKAIAQLKFGEDNLPIKETELAKIRNQYFTARTPDTKKKYREQDKALRGEIASILKGNGFKADVAGKLANWDPYDQNAVADFFDPEWMFSLTAGFDIVIGNPPYVRQEQIKEQKPLLAKALPEVYAGTADLYVYFYGRGFQLLREGGYLAYISSNKFFRADYGKTLRQFFATKVRLQSIIDFGDLPVFKATAYPCILIGSKGTPLLQQKVNTLSVKSLDILDDLPNFIHSNVAAQPQSSLTAEGWNIGAADTHALLTKIRAAGQPLEKYIGGKFYYGIKTGFNEAFIIDEATCKRLIAEDAKSAEIIKPFLRGKDIKRYKVTYAHLYLILSYRGIDIKKYPAIFKHLQQYETQLKAKAGGGQWYELQASPGDFTRFENPKIVYPDIAASTRFSYDATGLYGVNTLYFIPSTNKYLLGLLNSRVVEYYYKSLSSQIRGGYLRFFSIYVEQIPIPTPTPEQRARIEELVNQLIEQGPDVPGAAEWQQEIDQIVYQIYGLTVEEIALVEGQQPLHLWGGLTRN